MRAAAGLAVACAALLGLWASAATAAEVDFGVSERAPVGQLGCGESSPPIEFRASRGNSVSRGRGPDAQYVLEMKVRARPLDGEGAGLMSIHGEVGGEPGATIEVRRKREGGRWALSWSVVDLVDGTRTGAIAAGGSELETANYIPFGTVRPGTNRLRFRVECFGSAPVADLEVLGSTSLRETQRQPAHLRLSASEADSDPEAGVALPVPFEIANTGDLPAVDVEVQLVADGERVRQVGRTRYVFSRLDGEREGEFLIVPRRRGPLDVELVAISGNSNQPAVSLRGMAGKPSQDEGSVVSPWLGMAALTAVAALALVLLGRRRRAARGPA
ncbi:MAG TPA: hypothetical protein VGV69_08560 [Solirubrobacterales bacterium]|nr:hypothetical protein [Solirubrobacterales bacterium]